jgi:hypothetical protein
VGGVVSINHAGNKILKGFMQLLLPKEQTAISVSTTDKCCAGIRFLLLPMSFQNTLHQCSSKVSGITNPLQNLTNSETPTPQNNLNYQIPKAQLAGCRLVIPSLQH